jgi:hypothetical protein
VLQICTPIPAPQNQLKSLFNRTFRGPETPDNESSKHFDTRFSDVTLRCPQSFWFVHSMHRITAIDGGELPDLSPSEIALSTIQQTENDEAFTESGALMTFIGAAQTKASRGADGLEPFNHLLQKHRLRLPPPAERRSFGSGMLRNSGLPT